MGRAAEHARHRHRLPLVPQDTVTTPHPCGVVVIKAKPRANWRGLRGDVDSYAINPGGGRHGGRIPAPAEGDKDGPVRGWLHLRVVMQGPGRAHRADDVKGRT